VVVTSCKVSRPKSPSVERLERSSARVTLFSDAGSCRICSASCLVASARTSSGSWRRFSIFSAMGFWSAVQTGCCDWARSGAGPLRHDAAMSRKNEASRTARLVGAIRRSRVIESNLPYGGTMCKACALEEIETRMGRSGDETIELLAKERIIPILHVRVDGNVGALVAHVLHAWREVWRASGIVVVIQLAADDIHA
jgi:hypothetical protein